MNSSWQFSSWKRRDLLMVLIAFAIMMILQFPFTFFFDTVLTDIGFLYIYFWALPQAAILYFVTFRLRIRWTSTLIIGLMGIIGAPVDYYFDWVVQQNLIAPLYALGYIPLFIIMGLSADVSLIKLHPEKKPRRAALISSFVFNATVLLEFAIATFVFYPTVDAPWINMGSFLIPFSLATGTLGGYLGFSITREFEEIPAKRSRCRKGHRALKEAKLDLERAEKKVYAPRYMHKYPSLPIHFSVFRGDSSATCVRTLDSATHTPICISKVPSAGRICG